MDWLMFVDWFRWVDRLLHRHTTSRCSSVSASLCFASHFVLLFLLLLWLVVVKIEYLNLLVVISVPMSNPLGSSARNGPPSAWIRDSTLSILWLRQRWPAIRRSDRPALIWPIWELFRLCARAASVPMPSHSPIYHRPAHAKCWCTHHRSSRCSGARFLWRNAYAVAEVDIPSGMLSVPWRIRPHCARWSTMKRRETIGKYKIDKYWWINNL